MKSIRLTVYVMVGFLIALGLVAVVQHYLLQAGLVTLDAEDVFARHLARYTEHGTMEFLHLGPSFVFFLIAPLQFVSWIRREHPGVHRFLGRVYVVLGLLSGILGLLISIVFPFGGVVESLLVTPLAAFFLYAVTRGFLLARERKIAQHRMWMIRGLAAALAISLQRVILGLLMIGRPSADMPEMFNVAIALASVAAIGIAEFYLRFLPHDQRASRRNTSTTLMPEQ